MDSGLERLLGWKIEYNRENNTVNVYSSEDRNAVEMRWILQASFLFIGDALEFLLRKIKK